MNIYPNIDPLQESDDEDFETSVAKYCKKPFINKIIPTDTVDGQISMNLIVYLGNDKLYWKIIVDLPFDGKETTLHPFRTIQVTDKQMTEICADNELTRLMISYLEMSDKDLNEKSGEVPPIEYRARIIKTLTEFWD